MPTRFVKECQDILIGQIANIVNISLSLGVFPLSMKATLVKPQIKRHNLVCNVLKNYLPVSNLSCLSKNISDSNLTESRHSACRTGHNTETALIRMKNDIMMSTDQSKAVLLVFLDLSAAFGTVDHNVLFCQLEKIMFGLSGKVLEWF